MQILCLIWGIVAIAGMLVGFIPCIGAFNWVNIPLAVLGLVVSVVIYARTDVTMPRRNAMIGIVLCGIAVVFGAFRLFIGGGIF